MTSSTLQTRHPLVNAKSFHCSECNAINLVPPDDLLEDLEVGDIKHTMRWNPFTWIEFKKLRAELGMTNSQTMRILIYVYKKVALKEDRFDAINTLGLVEREGLSKLD